MLNFIKTKIFRNYTQKPFSNETVFNTLFLFVIFSLIFYGFLYYNFLLPIQFYYLMFIISVISFIIICNSPSIIGEIYLYIFAIFSFNIGYLFLLSLFPDNHDLLVKINVPLIILFFGLASWVCWHIIKTPNINLIINNKFVIDLETIKLISAVIGSIFLISLLFIFFIGLLNLITIYFNITRETDFGFYLLSNTYYPVQICTLMTDILIFALFISFPNLYKNIVNKTKIYDKLRDPIIALIFTFLIAMFNDYIIKIRDYYINFILYYMSVHH